MDKMMHARDQEKKMLNTRIERWFHNHFYQVQERSALHASLLLAKSDLKKILDIDGVEITKTEPPPTNTGDLTHGE